MRGVSWRVVGAVAVSCALSLGALPAFAAVSVKPGNAAATDFAQALQCVCHNMLLTEWQESLHSRALEDPIFKLKVEEADGATGGAMGPFCRRCHAPVANMTGQEGAEQLTPAAGQSVVCSFCHQVTKVAEPPDNVSHLLAPTGVMRAQLKDAQAPHFTRYSALHESSRFCGGCHDLRHPETGVRLLNTYTEWKGSPQAEKGVQCQDCHMSEAPPAVGPSTGFAAEAAPQRDNIYHMTFAGAQVALGNPSRATALLKSAAKIDLSAPDIMPAGGAADVTVKVTNVGAGHYLPTGVTEIRRMWLSVTVGDGDGTETELGRREFGTEFKDARGKHPVAAELAAGIAKDDRIPPMQSVTETYRLELPAGAQAADVRAQLLYQSVPDSVAEHAGVSNPTTVMAEQTLRVFATAEAKAADAARPPSKESTQGASDVEPIDTNKALLVCGGLLLLAFAGAAALWARSRRSPGA